MPRCTSSCFVFPTLVSYSLGSYFPLISSFHYLCFFISCFHRVYCVSSVYMAHKVRRRTAFQQSIVGSCCHLLSSAYMIWRCRYLAIVLRLFGGLGLIFATKVLNINGQRLRSALTNTSANKRIAITPIQWTLVFATTTCAILSLFLPQVTVLRILEICCWLLFFVDAMVSGLYSTFPS